MTTYTIEELILQEKFKEDISNYIQIQNPIEISISSNVERENNDEIAIFVTDNIKKYQVNIVFDGHNYEILDYEDLEEVIENEKFNFDIDYWAYNITYDQLARLYNSGKIKIPNMQRGFVWDDSQASRLIESILMGLPLPSLFLIKDIEEGKYLVVDGLQRITSIYSFRYNKRLPNRPASVAGFSLKNVNQNINLKTYSELAEEGKTDKFDMGTINVIEFKQNKPDHEEAMYTLFERLNSGGTNLSPQQIRNSIYYGTFNNLLNQYSNLLDQYFSKKAKNALTPSENLLRIVSIYDYIRENHKNSLENKYQDFESLTRTIAYKSLYNETANKYHMEFKIIDRQNDDNKLEEFGRKITDIFEKIKICVEECENIFAKNAFKRYDHRKNEFVTRFTPVLLESLIVTMLLNNNRPLKANDEIISNFKEIFYPDKAFERYFSQGTGRLKNIFGRIVTLESILYENVDL
ncbi:TPA: DUF262 domain-containing protein [Listeria monocytogenes]|nr:DUF262 domain-containing protein [Listeria monocytogenes]